MTRLLWPLLYQSGVCQRLFQAKPARGQFLSVRLQVTVNPDFFRVVQTFLTTCNVSWKILRLERDVSCVTLDNVSTMVAVIVVR